MASRIGLGDWRPRILSLVLVILALAACSRPDTLFGSGEGAPTVPASRFQAQLDRQGIRLTLPPGRAILVNIPQFELIAFEQGEPVLRSRIIVGTPWNRTPRIDTYTTRVTFRPSWRPTPSMVASGEYSDVVRPPGENNPLGLAAIRLQPGLLIYLHDTNQRHLFDREMRALSHGCIRVEKWQALIAWLLDRDEAWVHRMAEAPPTKEIPAPEIPVLIRYLPVFPAADGQLVRYPDIYGLEETGPRKSAAATPAEPACAP